VGETELVAAAKEGDVGIIPYTPTGANYTHCCPNKTSQYMAAGLPILANNTTFVNQVIGESGAGRVVDFNNASSIVREVLWFVENSEGRVAMGNRARLFFEEDFNWDRIAAPMYLAIDMLIEGRQRCPLRIYQPDIRESQNIPDDILNDVDRVKSIPLILLRRAWRILPVGMRSRFGPQVRQATRRIFDRW
jgi:hypothetical protein